MTFIRPNRRRIALELQTGGRPACALRRAGLPPIHNSRGVSYDAAGRRISKNGEFYSYNERSELTGAVDEAAGREYGYKFDDIGNRESAFENSVTNRYAANALNQYAAVDDFTPQYDDDGNQTLVKTATGVWSVTYNGENRPVRWVKGDEVVAMAFDRMGRRVAKNNQRFVYDGYLQIADNGGNAYVWDATENVATRPLVWNRGGDVAYYAHDGNKNVSDIIASNGDIVAHYDYAPFGGVTAHSGALASANPWRFSSEYADDNLGLVYYNYRHYDPVTGRWLQCDLIEDEAVPNSFCFCNNESVAHFDVHGLEESSSSQNDNVVTDGDGAQTGNGTTSTTRRKCRIDIFGGHNWEAGAWVRDKKKSNPNGLPLGDFLGTVSCLPGKTNKKAGELFPGQIIPGLPDDDELLWPNDSPKRPANGKKASQALMNAWKAASKTVNSICENYCCESVTIEITCSPDMKKAMERLHANGAPCGKMQTFNCPKRKKK